MNDTKMISVNRITINISDAEMVSNSEIISEKEIYGNGYMSVNGKTPSINVKTADSIDDISIKESDIRIRIINDAVCPDSIHFSIN
jgi:hypothetical protein